MTVPIGKIPRRLYQVDEDVTVLAHEVRQIATTQREHTVTLADLGAVQREHSTALIEIKETLGVILSRLPQR